MRVRGQLYAPGERHYGKGRRNRWYVYIVRIAGKQREYVCRDESGRPTSESRVARRDVRRIDAKAERECAADAPASPVVTFADAAAKYADARNLRKAERKFIDRLVAEIGERTIRSIRQHDIDAAAKALYGSAMLATRNRQAYAPAAAILHYAAKNEWCEYRRIERLEEPQPETRRPSPTAIPLLLANTKGLRRLFILVIARQGWRVSETLAWQEEKIDFATGMTELWVPKVKRWQTVPLHFEVVAALANRTDEERWHAEKWMDRRPGFVFPWRQASQIYFWLRPLCRKLGIKFTPHMARHEFASAMREQAGATPRDLVDAGSWTSERSTARYDRAPAERARALINKVR